MYKISISGCDGHSGRVTPGLIPNPTVKPATFLASTVFREGTGNLIRCRTLFPYVFGLESDFASCCLFQAVWNMAVKFFTEDCNTSIRKWHFL